MYHLTLLFLTIILYITVKPDAFMTEPNLIRITSWLKQHAPRITDLSLNPPATDEKLKELQGMFDRELPADLIQLYKTYNGMNDDENMGNLFYGMPFLSIEDVIADQQFRIKQSKDISVIPLRHADEQIDPANVYNLNWVALCFDGSRSYLRVDLAPSPQGTYGQVIFIDSDYNVGLFIASSITELLEQVANDMENGLYYLNEEALEDEHHFLDVDNGIDIVNWHHIERWQHYT